MAVSDSSTEHSTVAAATTADVNPSKSTSSSATIFTEVILMTYYMAILAWSWNEISENTLRNCLLALATALSLFLLKIIDAMVDDGLSKSTWVKFSTAIFTSLLGMGLMVSDDFCAIFLAGMTVGCSLAGKLDCIEFQLIGGIWMSTYVVLSLFVETSHVNVSDVVVFVVIQVIEELLHDLYGFDSKKWHGESMKSRNFFMDCIRAFAEHRIILGVVITALYTWKGYYEVVFIMASQDFGYDAGTWISNALLKRKEMRK